MELLETITKRRSIRNYSTDKPSREDLMTILNAARLAPSSHNKQMWHYLVIYNDSLKEKLSKAVATKYDEIISYPEAAEKHKSLEISKKFSTFFHTAPVLIAALMKPTDNAVQKIMEARKEQLDIMERMRPNPDLQSMGASIQNMLLAAQSLGYGTCWCTAPLAAYKEMEEILQIDPEYNLIALITLGKPDPKYEVKEVKRKSLDEIVTIIE
jgi:nitroreductase